MVDQKDPEFIYNEDMEKKFGEPAQSLVPKYRYGNKTFRDQRAQQTLQN